MSAEYDVFISHAWADGDRPREIADALRAAGLKVWIDEEELKTFESITRGVQENLARSKALLAYYSKSYPTRRACQWELTAAFLAAQQEGDPRRRVLVVNPEQDEKHNPVTGHIHPIELRDAKFFVAPKPGDGAALKSLAEAVRNHVASLAGPLGELRPLAAPTWYGMKGIGSTRFVGRMEEMWRVHSLLHAGDVTMVTGANTGVGAAEVRGLGGVGKSLLVEEYALRFGAAYPGEVFWLLAHGNDDAKAGSGQGYGPEEREAERGRQVQAFAEALLGAGIQGLKPGGIEDALGGEIKRRGKACLWVVDDLAGGLDGQAVRRWFAPDPLARTLITTRSREYGAQASGLDLSVLSPDEAYQLLTSRRTPANEAEIEQAGLVAEDLGRHALAVDVAGAALGSFGGAEPFREFRRQLTRKDQDALDLAEDLADALPNGHEASIAQTLLRSIHNLGAEGQDFLRLASVLAVAPIPADLVAAVFEKAGNSNHGVANHNEAQWRQARAFKEVTAASLAEVAGEKGDSRSVHTLVSRAVRFRDRKPERTKALRTAAVEALLAEIPEAAKDIRLHRGVEFHVAHAREIVATPATVSEADLLGCVGRYDFERGAYASAGTLRSRELGFRRRVLGPEHPGTLTAMSNLAATLEGDVAGARKLQEEALAASRRVLGPEHPDTLTSMNNLGATLGAQGDLAGARKLTEEALAVRRRVLGPEHPDTLNSMNSLAVALRAEGDVAGARKLLEETFAARRRVLGHEHPRTLTSMNNLAATLRAQGDLVGARKLGEETLAAARRVLGLDHPHTLTSMNNLAVTFRAQGDLPGARKLQEETLAVSRQVLGSEHPLTLTSMISLAETLREQGDWAGARKLQEETLAIHRRVLGPEHASTSISAWSLFLTLDELAERDAARAILGRDLLWLLGRDPATLGADQRNIREMVAQVTKH